MTNNIHGPTGFSLPLALQILERTPAVLQALLAGLADEWTTVSEGEGTWTVTEVVAHLIICEETNWWPRAKIILSDAGEKRFSPMDMQAHFELAERETMQKLLSQFSDLRQEGLAGLAGFDIGEEDLSLTGTHSVIGEVSLQHVLSTWVAHDLTHLAQIARIMAKQNRYLVGPSLPYLRILN